MLILFGERSEREREERREGAYMVILENYNNLQRREKNVRNLDANESDTYWNYNKLSFSLLF